MTREEAIKTLREDYCGNRIICELYPDQCNREDCEIWLAIRALVEQPVRVLETQPDGDVISRQVAIDAVESFGILDGYADQQELIYQIRQLPSAQPKPDKNPHPEQPDSDRLGVKTGETCTDTISRQAAIDALKMDISIIPFAKAREYVREAIETIYNRLEELPSAQPEVAKDTNVGDIIYRQAAIDALDVLCQEHRYRIPGKRETYSQYNEAWQDALDRAEGAIFNLPSAQPDNDMIHLLHLQKEQAYLQGWEEGREALRREIWEDGRDRLY